MVDLLVYPYPTYTPNKLVASCFAVMVSISLIAWFIQSLQTRFRPPRLIFLLFTSHLTIFIELIVRAVVPADQQNSRNSFLIASSLFTIGQRMIIVSNYIFILDILHKKTWLSRLIVIGAVLCVVTSGILTAPANMLSVDPNKINSSFFFRKLSASFLLAVTLLFYPAWYWSQTIKDMTAQATTLVIISSTLCAIAATFTLGQSIPSYYDQISGHEGWFYALQMVPIIFAHFTWSIFHPKRSLPPSDA